MNIEKARTWLRRVARGLLDEKYDAGSGSVAASRQFQIAAQRLISLAESPDLLSERHFRDELTSICWWDADKMHDDAIAEVEVERVAHEMNIEKARTWLRRAGHDLDRDGLPSEGAQLLLLAERSDLSENSFRQGLARICSWADDMIDDAVVEVESEP